MISIILNVGPEPRLSLLKQCLPQTFARTGRQDYELLVCDNGTNCQELADFLAGFKPVYFRRNSQNQGNYQMLNQLLLRASGDYIGYIGGDIEYPENWLNLLVCAVEAIPQTGMVGFHCVGRDKGTPQMINGIDIRVVAGAVFGGGLWSRSLHDTIGYFYEGYGLYGLGDSDWGLRIRQAGLLNYFVGDHKSVHRGGDIDNNNKYRQMKWRILKSATPIYKQRVKAIAAGDIYVAPPQKTEGDIQ